jgi:hypothetical protein
MNFPECTGCGVEHRKSCPASTTSLAQQGLRILIAAGCMKSGVAKPDDDDSLKQPSELTVVPTTTATWWCCSAEFGEHEPTCKNFVNRLSEERK